MGSERLTQRLAQLVARIELAATGTSEDLRRGEQALSQGDPLEARRIAKRVLSHSATSLGALALWADACAKVGLDEEHHEAVTALSERLPWRQDVWLRRGLASLALGHADARQALERAAAGDDPAISREALFALADQDVQVGALRRALRWLARVPQVADTMDRDLALRRAEILCALGDREALRPVAESFAALEPGARGEGRVRLVCARLAHHFADLHFGGDPISLALGAMILDVPGADALLRNLVAASSDAVLIERVRAAVRDSQRDARPEWRVVFALAEGRQHDALEALGDERAPAEEERRVVETLLERAAHSGDVALLANVCDARPVACQQVVEALSKACAARGSGRLHDALAALELPIPERFARLGAELLTVVLTELMLPEGEVAWDALEGELAHAARSEGCIELLGELESLAVERERPLRVAVLGEFNAGKSTFINALVAADVAPTGIRPTTAALHWLAWAPDRFARIAVRAGSDRVVTHADLKKALGELHEQGVEVAQVHIYAPFERLKHIEVIDTPGFNAPVAGHRAVAERGIDEAHLALWLFDATAPLKETERQMLQRVAELGVPVQVLINKSDRLSDGEGAEVLRYTTAALEQAGLRSLSKPQLLSARQALRGLQGDGGALASSGWSELEAMLQRVIVDRSVQLRDAALLRRADRIAGRLCEMATARAVDRDRARNDEQQRREALARAAQYIDLQRVALAQHAVAECAGHASELMQDLRAIAPMSPAPSGASATVARSDEELDVQRYAVERTHARLAEAIAHAVAARITQHEPSCDSGALLDQLRAPLGGALAVWAATGVDVPLTSETLIRALTALASAWAESLWRAAGAPVESKPALAARIRATAAIIASEASKRS